MYWASIARELGHQGAVRFNERSHHFEKGGNSDIPESEWFNDDMYALLHCSRGAQGCYGPVTWST